MKTIFLICGLVIAAGVVAIALKTSGPSHFGDPFQNAPLIALSDLVTKPESHIKMAHRVEGKILRQCPATGHWFYLDAGNGSTLHVEMSSRVGELPQHVGDKAVVEGSLLKMGEEYQFFGDSVEFR